MKKVIALLLLINASMAFAGPVQELFARYKHDTILKGLDVASLRKRECQIEFRDYSDGRTMGYAFNEDADHPYFFQDAYTDSYESDYKGAWFDDYVYTTKSSPDGLSSFIRDYLGGAQTESYKHKLKVFFDKNYKITSALYTDVTNDKTISHCKFK